LFIDKYITGSCSISNGVVRKNEKVVFTNPSVTLHNLLVSIYQSLKLSYPKFYKMDNLCKLGWLAAETLLQGTSVQDNYKPGDVGLILANANSSLDNDQKFQHSDIDVRSPSVFVYTLPNIVIGEICIRHYFKGEHCFFIQDEFNTEFIYKQVNYLFDQHILEACICGWIDVLGEEYNATLFLIEKEVPEKSIPFSVKDMSRIFNI
jgi:hypothetical protein